MHPNHNIKFVLDPNITRHGKLRFIVEPIKSSSVIMTQPIYWLIIFYTGYWMHAFDNYPLWIYVSKKMFKNQWDFNVDEEFNKLYFSYVNLTLLHISVVKV